ncbi:MAG: T9SS type A sorting domain-containing protein [Ignavibacteriae bacterium]|nr:T9SS type A sorting domain-containing protein [Ignavibacteriota bacterium]MCB9244570.1 T9SS type A sorting domain-containing protein [Ignavibacteriales bacterium]
MKKTIITVFGVLFCTFQISYSQTVSTLVPGPSTFDDCLTLDGDGNIYASRYVGTTITKITPAGMTSIFASGLSTPNGTAFGPDGYLYVPNNVNAGRIDRISPGGVVDTFITSIQYPTTVYFESDTSMLICSYQLNRIYRANISGSYSILYTGSGMNGPVDMDRDTDGNLLVANFTDGKIFRVDSAGTFNQIADLPGTLGFMVVANGYIYTTALQVNKIFRTSMNGDTVTFAGTGGAGQVNGPVSSATFSGPNGIAVTTTGDTLYVSDFNTRSLRMITGVTSGIININSSAPEGFDLKQNYPNPFNPSTKIEFSIPQKGFTSLKVFDSLGKEIETLVSETLSSGTYATTFNGSSLSSGVYFVRLQSNGNVITSKMMLIK